MKKSNAISALGALAQESRLDIFRLLIQKGPQGVPAGDIGERLGLPPPRLSFHLNQLRYAGLVSSHLARAAGWHVEKLPRTTWLGTPLHELWLKDPDGNLVEVYARLTEEELAQRPPDAQPIFLA